MLPALKVGERSDWKGNAEPVIVFKKNYTSETPASQLEWTFKTSVAVSEMITLVYIIAS